VSLVSEISCLPGNKILTIFHPDHVTYEVRLDTYTYIQYNKKNKQIKLEIQDKNNKH